MGAADRASQTLECQVTARLTEQILDQRLRPGEHIVAADLARALGVSRLPVREALRNLTGNGLVELRPHRGAFVTMVGMGQVDLLIETIEVRALLEPQAAALAATRHDELDLQLLDRILVDGSAAVHHRDRAAVNRAHHRYLRAVAGIAGHETLDRALAPLHHRTLLAFVTLAFRVDPGGWDVHRQVRDAVAARDTDAAGTLTRRHLDQVLAAVRTRGNLRPAVIGH